jgi:hypothetical protein
MTLPAFFFAERHTFLAIVKADLDPVELVL